MNKNRKWLPSILGRIAKLGQDRTKVASILDVIGPLFMVIGVFLFSIPLGFIALGIAAMVISWLITQNGEPDGEPIEPYQRR